MGFLDGFMKGVSADRKNREMIRNYHELYEDDSNCIRRHPVAAFAAVSGHGAERVASFLNQ